MAKYVCLLGILVVFNGICTVFKREHCVPILSKLWTIKDLHVRMILLRFFPFFVGAYDTEALETFIMPQMLIGLRDTDDSLVSATFHALAALVPLLGGEVVVGGQRQKYFTEGRPKFSMGVSPVTKNNTHIHKSSDQKQTKAIAPLNVLDALHMHPKPNLKEEKPPQKITSEEQKQKERNRQKHREEMERKREKLQKERELKKAKREKERDENEKARKTLLELAKEQALEIVVPEHEVISKEDELDDDFEDWDEFETAEPEPEPEPSVKQKLKTSPTRFQTSSSQKFDLTDVDFAPLQNNSARNEPDLIAWNNDDRSPKSDSQKPDREILVKPFGTGRGMKLSTKKPSLRSAKPKPPEGGDLGKMFEIPDITIKPQEPDFFSDMQPELEFKRYDGGVGGANVSTGYSTMMSVQNTAQVEAGWDDEDWADLN
ncbi:predicted protein [Nematostella vectensis]|uniref:Uncharacterized protein n=1 Tax=Nematostella vectensis TaxID=45351 RepID=A7SPI9_NEMVE|nr:predicted protein [Nematostella vectensis]|eukprot:XP_001626475.1 predicted protein [Nematostella vectensis]